MYKNLESKDFGPKVIFGKCAVGEHTKTYPLKTAFDVQLAEDLKQLNGLDAEEELINILVEEITLDVIRDIERYAKHLVGESGYWKFGEIIHFRDVDPNTFRPRIGFKYTLSMQ